MSKNILVVNSSACLALVSSHNLQPQAVDAMHYHSPLANVLMESYWYERELAEEDPTMLQLIPYVVLVDMYTGKVFSYRRTAKSAEARLHAKYSVGVGGHIDCPHSNPGGDNLEFVYRDSLLRELKEEVGLDINLSLHQVARTFRGFLYNTDTPVSSVHLGCVHEIGVMPEHIGAIEPHLDECNWVSGAEAAALDLESWSASVVQAMRAPLSAGDHSLRADG